jgi:hypothetical protein
MLLRLVMLKFSPTTVFILCNIDFKLIYFIAKLQTLSHKGVKYIFRPPEKCTRESPD